MHTVERKMSLNSYKVHALTMLIPLNFTKVNPLAEKYSVTLKCCSVSETSGWNQRGVVRREGDLWSVSTHLIYELRLNCAAGYTQH